MKRTYYIGAFLVAIIVALGVGSHLLEKRAVVEAAGARAPRFEVDPMWPKPLPNHWVIGSVIGVAADASDNIWIIHRTGSLDRMEQYLTMKPRAADCCAAAPPILEFNQDGDLIGSWGGPGQGYEWPASNHGIDVDFKGNVWIGGNGRGARPAPAAQDESRMGGAGTVHDSMVLKFTQSGKFLMQIGKPNMGKGSNDIENLRLPAKTLVDPKTNELYVADGYGNRRVIVFDADTGKYKRHWGLTGTSPTTRNCRPTIRTIPRRGSSARRCIAWILPRMDCCMFATGRMTASRCSRRMGGSSRKRLSRKTRWGTARYSTSRCRKIPNRSTCTSPMVRT